MIRELHINNYKFLHELTLDVGRFNVFIGENSCGKSNLLEAIALAATDLCVLLKYRLIMLIMKAYDYNYG